MNKHKLDRKAPNCPKDPQAPKEVGMHPFKVIDLFLVTAMALFGCTGELELLKVGNTETDWTYVSVGLEPAWATEGVELLRGLVDDDDMTDGVIIHQAQAGGGITQDSWSGTVELPFLFKFFGVPFDKFCVSKSGLLTFNLSVANAAVQASQNGVQDLTFLWTDIEDFVPEGIQAQSPAADLPVASGDGGGTPPGLPNPKLPNNTIAYYWGQFFPWAGHTDAVYYFVYGAAPYRQAWIINPGHRKKGQHVTYTALVLEETSNRFFIVDMSADDPNLDNGFLTVGAQRDPDTAQQMPASSTIRVVGESTKAEDNAIYVFQPYQRYTLVNGDGHPDLDGFDEIMFDYLEVWNLPGALVAASQDGRLVFSKGYGYANVEAGIGMQPWHRGGIGSVSKVLTALGVMKAKELSEELGFVGGGPPSSNSSFSLDDPLYGLGGLFVGAFEENIQIGIDDRVDDGNFESAIVLMTPGCTEDLWLQAYHNITVRHLLTHTSGFRGLSNKTATAATELGIPYEDITYEDIHRYYLTVKPLESTPPGSNFSQALEAQIPETCLPLPEPLWKYENHNTGVAGMAIEAVTGTPYIEFMQSEIFGPLGLNVTNTIVYYEQLSTSDAKRYPYYRSSGSYHNSNFDGSRVYGDYGISRGDLGATSGGWVISGEDLVRLLCATDQLNNQPDILQPETLDEMESAPFPSMSWQALGWERGSFGKLEKNGLIRGAAAYMAKYGSGINVAVIFNAGAYTFLPTELAKKTPKELADELEKMIANAELPEDYDLFIDESLTIDQ